MHNGSSPLRILNKCTTLNIAASILSPILLPHARNGTGSFVLARLARSSSYAVCPYCVPSDKAHQSPLAYRLSGSKRNVCANGSYDAGMVQRGITQCFTIIGNDACSHAVHPLLLCTLDESLNSAYTEGITGCSAAWLARLLWEQEAPSSNLGIPTTFLDSPQTLYSPALALPASPTGQYAKTPPK